MPPLLEFFDALLKERGPDLGAWALGWARALPVVTIVPAFGLSAVALPIRIALAVALAASAAPALTPLVPDGAPFLLALVREALLGLPVALAASALLWAAIMAGGLADNLRGAHETSELPLLDEPGTPLAALFGLFAALAFLELGGVERLAIALADPTLSVSWSFVAVRIAGAIGIALSLAAPVLAGSLLVELAGALVARSSAPAFTLPLIAPLRSLSILAVLWVSFDRMAELVALFGAQSFVP